MHWNVESSVDKILVIVSKAAILKHLGVKGTLLQSETQPETPAELLSRSLLPCVPLTQGPHGGFTGILGMLPNSHVRPLPTSPWYTCLQLIYLYHVIRLHVQHMKCGRIMASRT